MQTNKTALLAALFALFFVGKMPAQGTPVVTHLQFYAKCDAAQAIPQSNSKGQALVTLFFERDRKHIQLTGLLTGLSAPLTAAYLHYGKHGQKGDTVLNLMPYIQGRKINGKFAVPPRMLERLLQDEVYAEFKTTAFPNGELRGQTEGETDLNFSLEARGKEVVPLSNAAGVCIGGFHFAAGSDDLDYALLCRDLSGPVTAAAIYEGETGQNGTKVADMPNAIGGNILVGLIDTDDLAPDFFEKCKAGKYYVLVRTASFPDGEVRAQIKFMGYLNALSPINANQPVPPPPGSPGFGMLFCTPNKTLDTLNTTLLISGITPTATELRLANPGANGPVLSTFDATATPGVYVKNLPVTDTLLGAFVAGKLYANFPTNTLPNGEIRGQYKTSLRRGYFFDLCGKQQLPSNNSTALGMAEGSVDQNDCYFHYVILSDSLSSDISSANLHRAKTGLNGGVLHPVDKPGICMDEDEDLLEGEGPAIENTETYFSVNTQQFPDGEVRGQVRRGLTCPLVSSENSPEIRAQNLRPNLVNSEQTIHFQVFSESTFPARLLLTDAVGRTVWQQQTAIVKGEQALQMTPPSLPSGRYHIVLQKEMDGQVFSLGSLILVL